jgi:E3 ubiquitin-protein ligase makorin
VAGPEAVAFFEAAIEEQIAAGGGGGGDGAAAGTAPPPPPAAAGGPSADASAASAAAADAADAALAAGADVWLAAGLAKRDALLERAVAAGVACDVGEADTALAMAERNVSGDITCTICMEEVTAEVGRRFGLLTGCTHAFCLECIREWRGRVDLPAETTRACPVCRTLSYLVIPCERFIADVGRKAIVASDYHGSQRRIPCRHYNYGKGTCPFGTSCFYAHLNADGTPAVAPKHTIRLDAEGNVGVGRSFKLNEFLFK